MDYNDVKAMIRDAISEELGNYFTERRCPKCSKFTKMLKYWVEAGQEDEDIVDKFRCLNCMSVFIEKLELEK